MLCVTPYLKKLVLLSEGNVLNVVFDECGLEPLGGCNERNGIDTIALNALEYTISSLLSEQHCLCCGDAQLLKARYSLGMAVKQQKVTAFSLALQSLDCRLILIFVWL